MKTEQWSMEYRFERPPRWDPARPERPAVVYLDQWCWDQLVRDRAGDLFGTPDAGIYERLKDLAAHGHVVFPLSKAHYIENRTRTNADARWDTAVVMAELGGFVTMTMAGLVEWDAEVAVASYLGADPPPDPQPFGWGFQYCMTGVEGTAHIVDRFAAEEHDFAATLNKHGRTPANVRNWLNFLTWRDSMQYIELASTRLGVDPFRIMDDIADAGSVGDATVLDRFVALMPIQRTYTELRIAAHSKSNFNFRSSDRFDFLAAATAMPFADYVVIDRRTFNLLNDSEPNTARAAQPMRRLRDLCAALDDRLAD